ncbi:MAG: SURF1 family protein [Betaproteobacteria bacterium]|nr:SURF1 family protein [Betaproteobacteria bacterium]
MMQGSSGSFPRCYASFPPPPAASTPMTDSTLRFRPRWLPTFATLVAMALTGYLGTWQKGRAEEKRQLQSAFDARHRQGQVQLNATSRAGELRYRRAKASGRWHGAGPMFVDNRIHEGRAGFHVLMPLALDGGGIVLVQMGWIARDAAYPNAPHFNAPSGPARVDGVLDVPNARFIEWTNAPVQGRVWQNLTLERYQTATRLDALPFVLAHDSPPAGLAPVPVQPDARADKHTEYMWTWYSLCATVFALWILMNFKRAPNPRTEDSRP